MPPRRCILRPMRLLLRRLVAFFADCALLFVVLAPLGFAIQSALGVVPTTSRGVYAALLLNFSLPVWTCFVLSDRSRRGATPGKRLLRLRAVTLDGRRIGGGRALVRTAGKLLPWEATHASLFLIPSTLGEMGPASWAGLVFAYGLGFAYLVVAWRARGRRSVHDLLASTRVERSA